MDIETLPMSINSVLGQTYDNLEVIIVDDRSDDGTEEYVRGLTDSRVKYVKSDGNRGPSAARNLGVKQARGEYVAFQDSDDGGQKAGFNKCGGFDENLKTYGDYEFTLRFPGTMLSILWRSHW